MSTFLAQLQHGLEISGLDGEPILVAVSGGPDSVALIRGLIRVYPNPRDSLVVGHFNHQWRGATSDTDAAWVKTLAGQHDLRVLVGRASKQNPDPSEESARNERYRFLEESARNFGVRFVATAHTAEDQSETVLHHFLRGTGLSGLRGMLPVRPLSSQVMLARPMLHVSATFAKTFLEECRQDYRLDDSNRSFLYTRNRLRRKLLPQLASEYNPHVREAILRLAQQAMDLEEVVQFALTSIRKRCHTESPSSSEIVINLEPLSDAPRHLVRAFFATLWEERSWPRKAMGFAEWDALAEYVLPARNSLPKPRTFPGSVQVRRKRNQLLLVRKTAILVD